MKCLVTRLKAVVNNPNLPIFVDPAEFTSFIEATGNDTLTESQKYYFAKFLGALGAHNNMGIWPKIQCLILPIMCKDVAYSYIDYKSLSKKATPADGTILRNRGVVATKALNNLVNIGGSIDLDHFTLLWMRTEDITLPESEPIVNIFGGAILDSDANHKIRIQNVIYPSGPTLSYIFGDNRSKTVSGGFTLSKNTIQGLTRNYPKLSAISGDTIVETNDTNEFGEIMSSYVVRPWSYSQLDRNYANGFFLLADALSENEINKINIALKELMNSFEGVD